MARRKRPRPMDEGSLREIHRLFIQPLLDKKPERMTEDEWLNHIFHHHTSDIVQYVALKPFKLEGLFLAAPLMPVQGLGYRQVKRGQTLMVKHDHKNPDGVLVEYFGGQGGADQVFQLTASQWEWVKLHVREAAPKDKNWLREKPKATSRREKKC